MYVYKKLEYLSISFDEFCGRKDEILFLMQNLILNEKTLYNVCVFSQVFIHSTRVTNSFLCHIRTYSLVFWSNESVVLSKYEYSN